MKLTLFLAPLFIATYFGGCLGLYHSNLMAEFGIEPGMKGTTTVDGYKGKGKGVVLSRDVDVNQFMIGGDFFRDMIDSLSVSTDFTYSALIYLTEELSSTTKTWPLIAFEEFSLEQNYFGIGLKSRPKTGNDFEGQSESGELEDLIYIEQYVYNSRSTLTTERKLDSSLLKLNTWMRLMVRIKTEEKTTTGNNVRRRRQAEKTVKVATVSVTLDCKKIMKDFKLVAGPYERYKPSGFVTFGMEVRMFKDGQSNDRPAIKELFPGAIAQAEIINGARAFEYYSRCDANFTRQDIPSEALPSEYSSAKLDFFQEFSSSSVGSSSQEKCYYKDKNNATVYKYNGETWIDDDQPKVQNICNGTKIVTKYKGSDVCEVEDKVYRKGEKWIDPTNICLEHTCFLAPKKNQGYKEIVSEQITCEKLSCKYKELTKEESGKCCGKCASDTCTDGRVYNLGCVRRCSEDYDMPCAEKNFDCYCPPDMVENEDGKCIKPSQCKCKSGSKVYWPGQTAVRSSCSTCLCSAGHMVCFERC